MPKCAHSTRGEATPAAKGLAPLYRVQWSNCSSLCPELFFDDTLTTTGVRKNPSNVRLLVTAQPHLTTLVYLPRTSNELQKLSSSAVYCHGVTAVEASLLSRANGYANDIVTLRN